MPKYEDSNSKKESIAKYFRKHLETYIRNSHPKFYEAKMAGSCAISSHALQQLYNNLGLKAKLAVGTFYSSKDIIGHIDHSFVISGDLIIDITADQFGLDPVFITSIHDKRYTIEFYGKKALKELQCWPTEQRPTKDMTIKIIDDFEMKFVI